ncbi:MAG TPA: DUF6600 domain-containing protein [Bacteroidota bacterium]|nr:DUF6600 domain-containing protein [Bacteroidota bacterium]
MRLFVFIVFVAVLACAPAIADPPDVNVSFGVFYSSLGSYGDWFHVNGGVYAWRPYRMHEGWRPYSFGRWLWTDDGWYWSSDEPWGWATYHYGRWYYDDNYGWVWIPGYEWAPAWVEWRFGDGCMGWAPLGPYAVFSPGWGVHYEERWVTPASYWSFVDCRYINRPGIHDYIYRAGDNSRWIGRTRGAGSVTVEGTRIMTRGPARDYVERTGNIRIQQTDLVTRMEIGRERLVREPGGRESIEVYRPHITNEVGRGDVLRPTRVQEVNRPFSLDVRRTDIELRDVGRNQTRDLRSSDEYRRRQFESRRTDIAPPGTYHNAAPPTAFQQKPERRPESIERQTRIDRRAQRMERQATRSEAHGQSRGDGGHERSSGHRR